MTVHGPDVVADIITLAAMLGFALIMLRLYIKELRAIPRRRQEYLDGVKQDIMERRIARELERERRGW